MRDLIEKYNMYSNSDYTLWVYLDGAKSNDKAKSWYVVDTWGLDSTPDCHVGSMGKNFYFRTKEGINREKYDSFADLLRAIKKTAEQYRLIPAKYRVRETLVSDFEDSIQEEGNVDELIS